jgi:hypothetical protein
MLSTPFAVHTISTVIFLCKFIGFVVGKIWITHAEVS